MVELDSEGRRSVVDEKLDAVAQVVQHVRCRGRRHLAGSVRRRRNHGLAECGQNLVRHGMARHPHRDGVEPGGRQKPDRAAGRLRQHEGERPGPECLGEAQRGVVEDGKLLGGGRVRHMGDQRVDRRAFLDRIEPRHRFVVGGIGAEAVDGFGREGDEPARRQHAARILDRADACPRHAGHQAMHRGPPRRSKWRFKMGAPSGRSKWATIWNRGDGSAMVSPAPAAMLGCVCGSCL